MCVYCLLYDVWGVGKSNVRVTGHVSSRHSLLNRELLVYLEGAGCGALVGDRSDHQTCNDSPDRPTGKLICNSLVSTSRGQSLCTFIREHVKFNEIALKFQDKEHHLFLFLTFTTFSIRPSTTQSTSALIICIPSSAHREGHRGRENTKWNVKLWMCEENKGNERAAAGMKSESRCESKRTIRDSLLITCTGFRGHH